MDKCDVRNMNGKQTNRLAISRPTWHVKRSLDRNRALLKAWRKIHSDAHQQEVSESGMEWLSRRGYNFQYHTHLDSTEDGKLKVMCYDEGFVLDGAAISPCQADSLFRD